jgi:hypothetical protein
MNEEEDESRARVPSRANTEVNSFRTVPRDLATTASNSQSPAENQATPSALPRHRRLIPASIATRLAAAVPSASTPTTPARKYLERSSTFQERSTPQDRGAYQERSPYLERSTHHERGPINHLAERLAEERAQQQQRQISLGQTAILNRSASLGRRTRDSGIPSLRS